MFIVEHSAVDHCNALVGVKYFLPDHNHKEERALSVVKNFINIIYLFGYWIYSKKICGQDDTNICFILQKTTAKK